MCCNSLHHTGTYNFGEMINIFDKYNLFELLTCVRIRNFVLEQVEELCDEVSIDAMGNVLAVKKGKEGKKVMVAAHMDEIAFIIQDVTQN